MTHIYLIRHGETDWNRDGICMGQMDIPLNERGRRQAERTAERLASVRLDSLYTSDLSRALETARILARRQPHDPPIRVRKDLRELDYGHWQGYRREEIEMRFAESFQQGDPHRTDPLSFQPQGGESMRRLYERSVRAFREIVAESPEQTIAVVTHGGVIRHIVNYVLQQGAPRFRDGDPFVSFGFLVSNCGITHIVHEPGSAHEGEEWAIHALNDTCHLAPLGLIGDERPSVA